MKPRAAAGITLAGLMTACATAASPVDLAITGVTGIRDMGCDLELVR